jgi:serine phosphatase RsbU (regulator of sigma subunit)
MPAEVERADSTTGAGDVMLLYSDGLVELRNRDDEEYRHDRLVTMSEALDAEVRRDTRRMAASCLAHLTDFAAGIPRRDDLTIMAILRPCPHAPSRRFVTTVETAGSRRAAFGVRQE